MMRRPWTTIAPTPSSRNRRRTPRAGSQRERIIAFLREGEKTSSELREHVGTSTKAIQTPLNILMRRRIITRRRDPQNHCTFIYALAIARRTVTAKGVVHAQESQDANPRAPRADQTAEESHPPHSRPKRKAKPQMRC